MCVLKHITKNKPTDLTKNHKRLLIIYVNIGACTAPAAPAPTAAPSRFFPSLTHLISPSFLQLQQRLRPFLETLGHVDSEYNLKIDF